MNIICSSLLLLSALLAGEYPPAATTRGENETRVLYELWRSKHATSAISNRETEHRLEAFKDNLKYIDERNAFAGEGNRTVHLGLNRFADLTVQEYRALLLRRRSSGELHRRHRFALVGVNHVGGEVLPEFIDWREKGAVGPIKDQGNCGSGWAFSTTATIEGINQIATGDYIALSEQELVDCDRSVNEGCDGGLMDYAFEFVINNGGIDAEKHYPYTGKNGRCDLDRKRDPAVRIDDYADVWSSDEKALKKAVAIQPVSVSVEARGRDFQLYESGVFSGRCGFQVDHGVAIVGYGSENGDDYWIVRNSWGVLWGEDGYIRMTRNVYSPYGMCGVAMEPSYPIKNPLESS